MIESRRRAYLEAMGFDIWSIKPAAPDASRLVLHPGEQDTLLVCGSADEVTAPFALDVARVFGGAVVWGWPDPRAGEDSPTLEEAVGQKLFTRVVVFGAALGQQLFKGEPPMVIGSARIIVTSRIEDLAAHGKAKLDFWKQLSGIRVD